MKQEPSTIVMTSWRNPLGPIENITFDWRGKSPFTHIHYRILQELGLRGFPYELQLGPYHLEKVDEDPAWDTALYILRSRWSWVRVRAYRISRWFALIYHRTILTLAVWHLADFHAWQEPHWSDIYILRKLFRRNHD